MKQELAITGRQQLTQVQERIACIQDEVHDLHKQLKRMNLNVSILMNEMKELKLMLANLGNLMQLPPALPPEQRDTDPIPPPESSSG
jgi:hypothetical protein